MEKDDIVFLEKLDTFINKAMSDNTLSADQIAQWLYMSRSQLYRKLLILRGVSLKVYIQDKRFNYALQLLERKEVTSVKAAAHAIGVRKVQYFSEQFKERFGVLPSFLLK